LAKVGKGKGANRTQSVERALKNNPDVAEQIRKRGWTIKMSKRGHTLVFDENGHFVGGLPTAENTRDQMNQRRDLRRGCDYGCGGLDIKLNP